jgi:uncharacterized membrane protein required for colicin V production
MSYTGPALTEFESVDIVVGTIIGIACLRGFFLGLIREAFSLASLAAAYLAVRAFVGPVAEWVGEISGGRVNEALEPWVAGAVGLGFVDRVGGGLLGATEGVLVVVVLVMLIGDRIGRDHPALADSRTLAALEQMELLARESPPSEIDVASPPKAN